MAEISALGYEDLRYRIQENWTRIQINDDTGVEVVSLPTSATNVNWVHPTKQKQTGYDQYGNKLMSEVPSTQTLSLEIVIKGSDTGITLPVTLASSEIRNGTNELMNVESFTPFEMTKAEDQITITHNIEVPKVTV